MCCAKSSNRARAFSLIEVMIVIVIIGLLAGAVTLSTRHFMDKAKQTRARADIATYKSGLESFYAEFGRYPSSEEGLAALAPKFIDKVRMDPWSRPYQYNFPGRKSPYEIICFGSDGRDSGDGVASDITSEDVDSTEATK
jgi:general secretion pathway protein G